MAKHPIRDLPDFEKRVAAARARAVWDFGNPYVAGIILGAFLDPDADAANLAQEKAEIDTALHDVGLG